MLSLNAALTTEDTSQIFSLHHVLSILYPLIQTCTMNHWQVIQWYHVSRLGPLRYFICLCHFDLQLLLTYHHANLFRRAHCNSKMTLIPYPKMLCNHRLRVCWRYFHFINSSTACYVGWYFINSPTACSSGYAGWSYLTLTSLSQAETIAYGTNQNNFWTHCKHFTTRSIGIQYVFICLQCLYPLA